jgi:magnesium-protoporphyrin IX monomethyl ester (oxidative) cyclase
MLGIGKVFVQKFEPLGILYIAAFLLEAGAEVTVLDAPAEEMDFDSTINRIRMEKPDILGITTLTSNGAMVYNIGKCVKDSMDNTLVVLGNIHAAVYAKEYLANGVCDVVVHGEGEVPMMALVELSEKNGSLSDISSISYMDNGIYKNNPPAPSDLVPLDKKPARSIVKSGLYGMDRISNQSYVPEKKYSVKTMLTSRGCPNSCYFCVINSNQKSRYASADFVVDEIEELVNKHDTDYIYIMDPLFMGIKSRVFEICEKIISRKISVKWGCDTHINYIDPDLLCIMEKAGCFELSLGIESGNQKSLDIIKPGVTIPAIEKAVEMIRSRTKIKIEGLFILGIPGEGQKETLNTIKFAKSLDIDMAQFSILVPYPGSPAYIDLVSKGELDNGIRENNKLDIETWKRYSGYICFNSIIPIWTCNEMGVEELRGFQKRAFREFYCRPKIILRNLKKVRISNMLQLMRIAFKGML